MALDLHEYFYGVHSIGWDFAITDTGPVCIEGNENWGLPMMQIFDPKIIKKYFATLDENAGPKLEILDLAGIRKEPQPVTGRF
jgi:hypothetical protein